MSEPDKPETPPARPPPPPWPPPQYPYQPGPYPGSYPPPPPQPYAGYAPPPRAPQNGLGIASLVTAIIGLLTVIGGIILGIVAIILGFLGRDRVNRGEADNGGVATAGIILGFLGIIVSLVVIAIGIWGFMRAGGDDYIDCMQKAGTDRAAQLQCEGTFRDTLEDEFSITITPTP